MLEPFCHRNVIKNKYSFIFNIGCHFGILYLRMPKNINKRDPAFLPILSMSQGFFPEWYPLTPLIMG